MDWRRKTGIGRGVRTQKTDTSAEKRLQTIVAGFRGKERNKIVEKCSNTTRCSFSALLIAFFHISQLFPGWPYTIRRHLPLPSRRTHFPALHSWKRPKKGEIRGEVWCDSDIDSDNEETDHSDGRCDRWTGHWSVPRPLALQTVVSHWNSWWAHKDDVFLCTPVLQTLGWEWRSEWAVWSVLCASCSCEKTLFPTRFGHFLWRFPNLVSFYFKLWLWAKKPIFNRTLFFGNFN